MRSDKERLLDVAESCNIILNYREAIPSLEALANSRRDRGAILYELIIIGEAISKISPDILRTAPNISWRAIKDFRNIIAHEYFGVDWGTVWDVINNRIPELAVACREILSKLK